MKELENFQLTMVSGGDHWGRENADGIAEEDDYETGENGISSTSWQDSACTYNNGCKTEPGLQTVFTLPGGPGVIQKIISVVDAVAESVGKNIPGPNDHPKKGFQY